VSEVLDTLTEQGIRFSIDDFGTGYSSLNHLKRLPVSELKIDKSFVRDMTRDRDDEAIVRSTIDLAHNMGLRVVAEGVESLEVLDRLREMGCDEVQGYYIARPMPAGDLPAFIEQAAWGIRRCRG
jgi:EAL domain-containing protein (putative c-di-GMP-specific phosphodiesterase class I)